MIAVCQHGRGSYEFRLDLDMYLGTLWGRSPATAYQKQPWWSSKLLVLVSLFPSGSVKIGVRTF